MQRHLENSRHHTLTKLAHLTTTMALYQPSIRYIGYYNEMILGMRSIVQTINNDMG